MYMQIATNRFTENFSKNTVYRFLNNGKINWEKFTVMLSERIVNQFIHVSMKYVNGFRMLTLGWSDGNSFLPITHRLMSSRKDKNVIGTIEEYDKRFLSYKRRSQSRQKATDVMIDMLTNAIKSGHHAKYVLFDSWFSNPKTVIQIKKTCNLDTIAMVKKVLKFTMFSMKTNLTSNRFTHAAKSVPDVPSTYTNNFCGN